MFIREDFPELGTNLVAALTGLEVDDFAHPLGKKQTSYHVSYGVETARLESFARGEDSVSHYELIGKILT
jgi:hypothetical protein